MWDINPKRHDGRDPNQNLMKTTSVWRKVGKMKVVSTISARRSTVQISPSWYFWRERRDWKDGRKQKEKSHNFLKTLIRLHWRKKWKLMGKSPNQISIEILETNWDKLSNVDFNSVHYVEQDRFTTCFKTFETNSCFSLRV